jgi:hypothetical protein
MGRLRRILRTYRDTLQDSYKESEFFFVDKLGRPLSPTTLIKAYQKLRHKAGVFRAADGPRFRRHWP